MHASGTIAKSDEQISGKKMDALEKTYVQTELSSLPCLNGVRQDALVDCHFAVFTIFNKYFGCSPIKCVVAVFAVLDVHNGNRFQVYLNSKQNNTQQQVWRLL